MCFSLVSMLDFMGQNLTPLKSRLSKLQSWHQNFSCLVGPNEHFYARCLLSARTSHGTTFAPRLFVTVYKTLNSNLKAFCASNVYFFDSSYRKNFKFQLWFLVQNSINLHVPKDASLAHVMGGGNVSRS